MPIDPARREFAKKAIDAAVRKALDSCDRPCRRAFADLLRKVQHGSALLWPGAYVGPCSRTAPEPIVRGLLALAVSGLREEWLRPVEEWAPAGRRPLGMFSSLAHHLLARYPVPAVLLSAWFRGCDEPALRAQRWFRHVGLGGSLRTAGLPIALTKRAAHAFARASPDFAIEFALRWAQVRGMGGDEGLAYTIASTRLGREFDAPEFWDPVVRLLVRSRPLKQAQMLDVVEHLHAQRAEGAGFSLKGRTAESLARDAAEWSAERARDEARRIMRWEPSGIEPFRYASEDGRDWTIRELLGSDELNAEGKAMQHCVADYKWRCANRITTIWSLAVETPEGRRRRVTVEVDPGTREVVQAKARLNAEPDSASRAVLVAWARREGLKFE